MKQKIILQNRRFHFAITSITAIFFLLITMFFMQSSLLHNRMNNHINTKDSIKGITIHQETNFNVSARRLYETLLQLKRI